jgi:hypothetical protein
MNVEIGAEAVRFPEKEYINGIAVAVWVFGATFWQLGNTAVHDVIMHYSICKRVLKPELSFVCVLF